MRNDIIELFTDIDDDLIAGAMPEAQRPVELKADTRRFSWGKFAAAAACLAVVVVGGAFALKAVSGRGGLVSSENSDNLNPGGSTTSEPAHSAASEPAYTSFSDPASVVPEPASADYPEDAKYQYTGDFSELELDPYVLIDREPYRSFDQLVEESDLIVVGTFTDDARQNRPTDRLTNQSSWGGSFNKFRIDKVFCGEAEVGSEIVILDHYFVTNGKLMYVSGDSLTPMIKGEQWVYFLGKVSPEYGNYYYPLCIEGRYPVPGNENSFVLTDSHYDEDIYADVKKMLDYVGEVEEVECDDWTADKEFTMPEFPGDKFIWKEKEVLVSHGGEITSVMYKTSGITSLYLADLNSDDKRELIAVCVDDLTKLSARYFAVYDHANKKLYPYRAGADTTNYDLEMRDKELYVVTLTNGEGASSEPLWYFLRNNPAITKLPTKIPEFDDNTSTPGELNPVEKIECEDPHEKKEFTMPEFPGDKFIRKNEEMLVSHGGETAVALYGASDIISVYLADLNGDGKRELVNLCRKGPGLTANDLMVYDYANSKLYSIKSDTTRSYDLQIKGRELYVVTRLLGDFKAFSSKPLTLDMLEPITRCGLDNSD